MTDRLSKLLQMLEKSPEDPFLLYGAGMEYKKLGEHLRAIDYFRRAGSIDPSQCYAWYQMGQTFELVDQPDQARRAYRDGIAAAEMAGDDHARGELQAALDMMG